MLELLRPLSLHLVPTYLKSRTKRIRSHLIDLSFRSFKIRIPFVTKFSLDSERSLSRRKPAMQHWKPSCHAALNIGNQGACSLHIINAKMLIGIDLRIVCLTHRWKGFKQSVVISVASGLKGYGRLKSHYEISALLICRTSMVLLKGVFSFLLLFTGVLLAVIISDSYIFRLIKVYWEMLFLDFYISIVSSRLN